MKILVVGGGGREHALVWKIAQSTLVDKIYCAPGNGGISSLAECVPLNASDIEGIVNFAKNNKLDMVMVAPDDPLAAGMVDALEEAGIRAFGPHKNAALLESSKVFSKNLMKKYNIPTAAYEVFDDCEKALEYLRKCKYPIAVKADGLALGKGVVLAESFEQASQAVKDMMADKIFGNSGSSIVVEEFIRGPEVSILAFTDGTTIVPMVSAQDHKRIFDGDRGLNTGGMGTFSPTRLYTPEIAEYCMKNIYIPTIEAMNSENRKFKGVLFFGLMLTDDGVKVLEYNARFGDPETQVVLPCLKTDIIEIFNAIIDERLSSIKIEWEDKCAVCVVLASGGYPEKYTTGYEITGTAEAEKLHGAILFHAGTKLIDEKLCTSGGRVLGVTTVDDTMNAAIKRAYKAAAEITFTGVYYRKDIGKK